MFALDLAFAVELIALGLGITFLIWASRNEGKGVTLARFTGFFITLMALFGLLCTSYYGINYWVKGYFKSPSAHMLIMQQKMMSHKKLSSDEEHRQHQQQ